MRRILDHKALLARIGGGVPLLCEILQMFPGDCAKLVRGLEDAVARQDAAGIQQVAHTLKGTLGNLSATEAYETALHLEQMARSSDLQHVNDGFSLLKENLQRLHGAVAEILRKMNA